MQTPFVGSEAVAAGLLTPYQLRSRHVQLFPGIFVARDTGITARPNAEGAYRKSRTSVGWQYA